MSGDAPKSAYELAMERLREKDRASGASERPLTEAQRAAIAEARRLHQAKMAERGILHQDALRKAKSPEDVARANAELTRDGERLAADLERRIAAIRAGGVASVESP